MIMKLILLKQVIFKLILNIHLILIILETSTQPLEYNWEWTEISEESHGIYINLVKNPEKFTGYSGMSARLVWKSIQEENCFGGGDTETCFEKRVFYKLMSGLQSSIATQIARDYYFAPLGFLL